MVVRQYGIYMTLVMGYASSDLAFLVADTLLTPLFGDATGRGSHALKIHILSPQIAVALSGNYGLAINVVSKFCQKLLDQNPNDLPNLLFSILRDGYEKLSDDFKVESEFLLLQTNVAGNRLSKITIQGVEERTRGYIGDSEEYANLQRLRQPYTPPKIQFVQQPDGSFEQSELISSPGEIEFVEVGMAMCSLTTQKKSKTVGMLNGGGVRITISKLSGNLEYMQEISVGVDATGKRFGHTYLVSNEFPYGFGIYTMQEKTGYILLPGHEPSCLEESSETLTDFVKLAKEKYKLKLNGPTWST